MRHIFILVSAILMLVSCSVSQKKFDDSRFPASASNPSKAMVLIFFKYSQSDKAPEKLAEPLSDEFNRLSDPKSMTIMSSATGVDDFQNRNEAVGIIKIIYVEGKRELALQVQRKILEYIKNETLSNRHWTVMFVDKPDSDIRRGDVQVMIF